MWLVKPSNQNQGRGIEICKNLREIKNCIQSKAAHTQWVVQKYLEKPLLYKGRKFDIRVWTFINDKGEIYFCKHGYIRTSSSEFTMDNNFNFIHLTNNCLQQFGDNYGKFEDGNTLSFEVLQQYIDETFPDKKISLAEHIVPRIKDLILDTVFAAMSESKSSYTGTNLKNCFELLGYDFMIDEDFRVWLIEVNTNPYLGIPNAFIKELLPKMMDSLLSHILNPIYPLEKKDNEDLFECLFIPGKINLRREFSKDLIYPIEEFKQKVAKNRLPNKESIKKLPKTINKVEPESEQPSPPKLVSISQKKPSSRHRRSAKPKVPCIPKIKEKPRNESLEKPIEECLPPILSAERTLDSPNKNHKELSKVIESDKKRSTTPTAKIRRPIVEILKEAIIEGNIKKISMAFHRLCKHILSSPKSDSDPLDTEETIKESLQICGNSKILCSIVGDCLPDLSDLFAACIDKESKIKQEIKSLIFEIIVNMSQDQVLQKRLVNQIMLHIVCEGIILQSDLQIIKQLLEIFKNLLKRKSTKSYIPGETLENERKRITIIQHGVVLPLIWLTLNKSEQPEILQFVERIIFHNIKINELKWTSQNLDIQKSGDFDMLENERNSKLVFEGSKSSVDFYNMNTIKEPLEIAEYLDLWTGKELILSEYFFSLLIKKKLFAIYE